MISKPLEIPEDLVKTFVFVWNSHTSSAIDYRHRREVAQDWINYGWCYQFALVLKKVYGKECEVWSDTTGGHCWVKIGDLFYDSASRQGLPYPITFWGGIEQVERNISLARVAELWNHAGRSGPIHLKVIADTVRTWKKNSGNGSIAA